MKLLTKNTLASLVLFVSFVITNNAHAQVIERLKESVESAAKKEVENSSLHGNKRPGKVESDKSKKSLTNEAPSPSAPAEIDTTSSPEAENGGLFTAAKYESSYHFAEEMQVEITSQEKKKKAPEVTNMTLSFGEKGYMNEVALEKESNSTKIILDYANNTSITLDDKNKTGMAMSLNFMTNMIAKKAEKASEEAGNYTIVKTGNSKTIAGFFCEEYLMESDDMTMNVWLTEETVISGMDQAKVFATTTFGGKMNIPTDENQQQMGTMMESHMVEKGGKGATYDYVVKSVNKIDLTVNMSDYEFTKLY